MDYLTTVISGSFRRNMNDIANAITGFRKIGINVLAPQSTITTGINAGFTLLSTDLPGYPPVRLEEDFLVKISSASFLYVVNTNGYVGKSASAEMAYAQIHGIPIITSEVSMIFSEAVPVEFRDTLIRLSCYTIGIDAITNYEPTGILGILSHEPQDRDSHLKELVNNLLDELSTLS